MHCFNKWSDTQKKIVAVVYFQKLDILGTTCKRKNNLSYTGTSQQPSSDKKPNKEIKKKRVDKWQRRDKWLTTTITKGTTEKLLPSLETISTENLWRLRKQRISTSTPTVHCRMSCMRAHSRARQGKPNQCLCLSIFTPDWKGHGSLMLSTSTYLFHHFSSYFIPYFKIPFPWKAHISVGSIPFNWTLRLELLIQSKRSLLIWCGSQSRPVNFYWYRYGKLRSEANTLRKSYSMMQKEKKLSNTKNLTRSSADTIRVKNLL